MQSLSPADTLRLIASDLVYFGVSLTGRFEGNERLLEVIEEVYLFPGNQCSIDDQVLLDWDCVPTEHDRGAGTDLGLLPKFVFDFLERESEAWF